MPIKRCFVRTVLGSSRLESFQADARSCSETGDAKWQSIFILSLPLIHYPTLADMVSTAKVYDAHSKVGNVGYLFILPRGACYVGEEGDMNSSSIGWQWDG